MSFLRDLVRWKPTEIERNDGSFQGYVDQLVQFQSNLYYPSGGVGYTTTYPGQRAEPILDTFLGYTQGAYKANGVVFAVSMARMMLFSDVTFKFRRLGTSGGGNDLFGNPDLRILERPWPGGTTQALLARAEQDVTAAGTFFLARSDDGQRLLRRRPDWMQFILDAAPDEAVEANIVGYSYTVGGPYSGGQRRLYLAPRYDGDTLADCVHWSPIPDPEAQYRGMSWLTPVLNEIQSDKMATKHKVKFFENAATPNLAVSLKETVTIEQFRQFVKEMNDASVGVENAYKNLYLGGGADVKVIGANLQQLDFKNVQGAGETRICAAGRVPPIIVGLSEGLASATYSNYGQARRAYGDSFARPQWKSFVGAVAPLLAEPAGAELWYDARDVAFLREDIKDLAEVQSTTVATINAAVASGWTPESSLAAVLAEDLSQLQHSGLMSVQLQPPGAQDKGPTPADEAAVVATQATSIVGLAGGNAFELESIVKAVTDGDLTELEMAPEPEEDPAMAGIDPLTGEPIEEDPNAPLVDDPEAARSREYVRDGDGQFAHVAGGKLFSGPDPLKLADRIKLGPGESFGGSAFVLDTNDDNALVMAKVNTPGGAKLRLGLVYSGDKNLWRAADKGRTIELDEHGVQELRTVMTKAQTDGKKAVGEYRSKVRAQDKAGTLSNDDAPDPEEEMGEGVIHAGWGDLTWKLDRREGDGFLNTVTDGGWIDSEWRLQLDLGRDATDLPMDITSPGVIKKIDKALADLEGPA